MSDDSSVMPLDFANVVSILTERALGHLRCPGTLGHTTYNHVVQQHHQPQDLLTTSLDRGRPRTGKA